VTTPSLKAAPAATPAAPINQPKTLNKIAKDTDMVSVIITLKNRYGLESNASQLQRTQRRNNIRTRTKCLSRVGKAGVWLKRNHLK
jgi:hypothetical protein